MQGGREARRKVRRRGEDVKKVLVLIKTFDLFGGKKAGKIFGWIWILLHKFGRHYIRYLDVIWTIVG